MTCVICKHGQTHAGEVTVTLQRDQCTIIIKAIPADVCDNCDEYYLSDTVTEQLLARAELVSRQGVEVQILRYAA